MNQFILKAFGSHKVFTFFTAVILLSHLSYANNLQNAIDGIRTEYTLQNGQRYLMDGINCHGTSFQAARLLSYPSHVNKEELNYLLDNYCTPVSGSGVNIVAVQDRHSHFSHSFFHTDRDSIIEKRNLNRSSPVLFRQRGQIRGTQYFQCRRLPVECSQSELTDLRRQVQLVGFYYASISTGRSDFRERDRILAYLNQKITRLESFRASADCRSLKNLVLNRARSLREMGEHVSGLRLFIQQLPANKL